MTDITREAIGQYAPPGAVDQPFVFPPESALVGSEWPRFADLDQSAAHLPQLNQVPVMTVARDRWERLVTTLDIGHSPADVWRALTDPDQLKLWLAACHGSLEAQDRDCTLDFEDGEFFLCRPIRVEPHTELRYLWRWLGIGQATVVTWRLEPLHAASGNGNGNGSAPANRTHSGTRVTVVEEAINPPWDWQTWNGGGWPGILNQLSAYLRTGRSWRWPWRRMGPYAQIELPISVYEAWDQLFSPSGLKYWMLAMHGSLTPGASLPVMMGDASGMVEMQVQEVVQPGEKPLSFLPYVTFALRRPAWNCEVPGRLWLEPAGWGRCLLQVFCTNWENLPAPLQLSERRLVSGFWADAVQRAAMFCGRPGAGGGTATAPHNWGAGPSRTDMPNNQSATLVFPGASMHGAPSGEFPAGMMAGMMKTGAFLGKVMADMSGALVGAICLLGDRLGLFKDLAARGPATCDEFASRTGIHVRYAREWLAALRSAGYIDYEAGSKRFSLPAERMPVLADEGGPMFMGGAFQQLAGLFGPLDRLTDAFRTGAGVPQDAYPQDLRDGMERMSASWFNHMLVPMWIGAMPAVREKLERGAHAADVGCGAGRALVNLARAFPASRFVGYDVFAPAIARANAHALEAGLADRINFERRDVTHGLPDRFDLITMFDALHDVSDPVAVLRSVRRALSTDGVLLLMEIRSGDQLKDDGRTATILHGTGLLYTTPVALANNGNDLGLMGFGEHVIRRLCAEAGFGTVRQLPVENPINAIYEVRP